MENPVERVKILIIGSGPAGYTAAIYAARADLAPVLYTGLEMGGQLTKTTEVENFPGFPEGVDANLLMSQMEQQARRFGTDIRMGTVTRVALAREKGQAHRVEIDGEKTLEAQALIVATGASARWLGLPSEERLKGFGVSACATCDGFFYRKRTVAVVGGGDTACEEALYLASLAKKVYLIVRKPFLRASKVMQRRLEEKDNIEILFNCNTIDLFGDEVLEGAHIVEYKGQPEERKFDIAIDGFFLAIGHSPNTDLFKGQVDMDAEGYLKVASPSTATNVPGVFAAGDCADPLYQQAINAAASGCRAAMDADRFLLED